MSRRIVKTFGRRRGFTLIEAVIIIVALGVAIPPTLVFLDEANMRRADAVNATRATACATCVMEHILADVSSKSAGLGFSALANSSAYLDTAVTGLKARIALMTNLYTGMGMTYTVTIGALVDKSGVTTGVPTQDLFRRVTVGVTFNSASSGTTTVNISSMVTSL